MTPVIVLSDNFIANGSEPWRLPEIEDLKPFPASFATNPEGHQTYSRNARGSRPWVKPGTPGMEFRVGGLEKSTSGNISYDPDNHQQMTDERHQKVANIRDSIPTPAVHGPAEGDLLVVGWGSTAGIINSAVDEAQERGQSVSRLHLRHVWPLPHGLDEIFGRFKAILLPEMNMGQMARVLRSEYPHHNFISYPKVTGQPFLTFEIGRKIDQILES
jgi:2-oxoglutarate ferredoxin oxidoreductase subunit alpha